VLWPLTRVEHSIMLVGCEIRLGKSQSQFQVEFLYISSLESFFDPRLMFLRLSATGSRTVTRALYPFATRSLLIRPSSACFAMSSSAAAPAPPHPVSTTQQPASAVDGDLSSAAPRPPKQKKEKKSKKDESEANGPLEVRKLSLSIPPLPSPLPSPSSCA
jgi:hypothetical protein